MYRIFLLFFLAQRPGTGDAEKVYTQWLAKWQHGWDSVAYTQTDSPVAAMDRGGAYLWLLALF